MASGDSIFIFAPHLNQPPTANYATFDVRNGHLVLDFDGSTAEAAVFPGVVPQYYSSGALTLRLCFTMTTATSGAVVVETSIERNSTADTIDTDSFGTATSATFNTTASSGTYYYGNISHSTSLIDSITKGDHFRCKVRRLPSDAADTATGDMELLSLEIREA